MCEFGKASKCVHLLLCEVTEKKDHYLSLKADKAKSTDTVKFEISDVIIKKKFFQNYFE